MTLIYNPKSKDYWGSQMTPLKLEHERDRKEKEVQSKIKNLLREGKFAKRRNDSLNIDYWDTPEHRINEHYKVGYGFWIEPPTYFWLRSFQVRAIEGEYRIPFALLVNDDFSYFTQDVIRLKSLSNELNKKINSITPLKNRIKKLKIEISEITSKLKINFPIYSQSLTEILKSQADVSHYEYDNITSEKADLITWIETAYYGSMFGNKYAIHEMLSPWVQKKRIEEHIELIDRLLPLAKDYLVHQITKEHFSRGKYGKWDHAIPIVTDILNLLGNSPQITDKKAKKILREYCKNHILNEDVKLVKDNGMLNKQRVSEEIAGIIKLKTPVQSITGDYLKRRINKNNLQDPRDRIDFRCEYWD